MTIVTLSPKGQLTIPVGARKNLVSQKFLFEMKGSTITLRPVKIEVLQEEGGDELSSLSVLAEKSFKFWDNDEDDIYQQYYLDKQSL